MPHGFTLVAERRIPEINSLVRLYRHDKTGARLLSVINDDENKVFGITFRTPPRTSNGIAHIMEHSVLCGSRKYPVKEPFIELAKSSLNTFLNAMTYPDKTCYPVASQNLQDFYNLIDVYLDAVFYPLIPERTLQQEGWHFELENPDGPISFKGVVFNEMKGVYSSPDMLIDYEYSQRSLYPDTPYGLNSGGDPAEIPDLTYEEFRDFHRTYYHPSNAYIYFYGDDDPEQRLRYLDGWLSAFDHREVNSRLPLQPRFEAPRRVEYAYDSGGNPDARWYLTVNWLLPEAGDPLTTLSFAMLAHILTATPASPLRKALIESGLGEDLAGAGLDESLRQMYYSTGLKGIRKPEDLEKVEWLIADTLHQLARDGIDPETVAASVNTVEFRLREKNTGRFPRGLAMMLDALSAWLHDADPIEALAFEKPLSIIKSRLAQGERYFENLIRKHLLENPHRTTVILKPDPEEGKRVAATEQARLEQARKAMSKEDLERIVQNTRELKRFQETPDSPEALATIPTLRLEDIDRRSKTIPLEVGEEAGATVLYHDLFTNGILYLDLGFDLHALSADLLPYAGLFGSLLLEMGTETQDFVRLTQRIGRETGGISASTLTSAVRESDRSALWLFLRAKAVPDKAGELLAILKDILLTVRLDNRERFRQIVLERKAGLEGGLVPMGHRAVNQRLRARFTEADWVAEQMSGIDHLFFLRELASQIEQDWPGVLGKLQALRAALVNRTAMIANVTLDGAAWKAFRPRLADFLAALPSAPFTPQGWQRPAPGPFEGLVIPAQVNYVGKGAPLYRLGYEPDGSLHVIVNYLGTTYLWEKIRVQGGAYGGFSTWDEASGVYAFGSYRDPNLLATLDNYDRAADFLEGLDLSDSELTRAIIGVIGDLDAYLLPDAKGYASMSRWLTGYSDEKRQRTRDEVLSATANDFKAFAQILRRVAREGHVVVLGSQQAIEQANRERGGLLEVKKVL